MAVLLKSGLNSVAAYTPNPSPSPSVCDSAKAICLGDKKIRAVNNVLSSLGDFSFTNGAQYSDDGYIHLKLLNLTTNRKGYIKIKYDNSNKLVALRDDLYSKYDWVCIDPQGADPLIGDCYSPIRVFDDESVIEIGTTSPQQWKALPTHADPNNVFRYKMEIFGQKDENLDAFYQGCRCRFSKAEADNIKNQGIFPNIDENTWIRVATPKDQCETSLIQQQGPGDRYAICSL